MKAILFVVLFSLSLVLAQNLPGGSPLVSWAGSTLGVNTTWAAPSITGNTCSNVTFSNHTYTTVAYNFTSTRIRQVVALGVNGISVFVFNGTFNPQNPCGNIVTALVANNAVVSYFSPQVEDSVVFQANTNYIFVVSSNTDLGDFALAIYDVTATGSTTAGSSLWSPISFITTTTCTQYTSENVPFGTFSWVQPTNALVDITVGFAWNTSFGSNAYIALFKTNETNAAISADTLCTPTINSNLIYAIRESSSRYGHIYGINLVAGTTYTVVASGDTATAFANYGFLVAPSRIVPAVFAPGFTQPVIGANCTASTSTNTSYAALNTTSGSNNYKVVYALASLATSAYSNWTTTDDSAAFVYQGINVGTTTTAPSTCAVPLASSTTSFPASLNIAPNTQYSFVSAYSNFGANGQFTYNAYLVYVLTGAPAGVVNTNTTAPTSGSGSSTSTTGGQSTGTGATVGAATGTHGFSTANTTGSGTSTTAAGSVVVCSFAFVALAILALLF